MVLGNRLVPRAAGRGGFTLTEVIAAAGIISVLFLVAIPLLSQVQTVRGEAARQFLAQQEAENAMERLAALATRGELTPQSAAAVTLSPLAATLPDASLAVRLDASSGELAGQQVRVVVRWTTDAAPRQRSATLTAWFPQSEAG